MSFEVPSRGDINREISANAWTIDDVRESIPVSVVALPPRSRSKTYDHAVSLFQDLGAEVVSEADVGAWADDVAQDLYGVLVTGAR